MAPQQKDLSEGLSKLAERVSSIAAALHLFEERMKQLTSSLGRISALMLLQAGLPVGHVGALFNAAGYLAGGSGGRIGSRLSQMMTYGPAPIAQQQWAAQHSRGHTEQEYQSAGAKALNSMLGGVMQDFKGIAQALTLGRNSLVNELSDAIGARHGVGKKAYYAPSDAETAQAKALIERAKSGGPVVAVDTEYMKGGQTYKVGRQTFETSTHPMELGFQTEGQEAQSHKLAPLSGTGVNPPTQQQVKDYARVVTGTSSELNAQLAGQGVSDPRTALTALLSSLGVDLANDDRATIEDKLSKSVIPVFHGIGDQQVLNDMYARAFQNEIAGGQMPGQLINAGNRLELQHAPELQHILQKLANQNLSGSLQNVYKEVFPDHMARLEDLKRRHGASGLREDSDEYRKHHKGSIDAEMTLQLFRELGRLAEAAKTASDELNKVSGPGGPPSAGYPLALNDAAARERAAARGSRAATVKLYDQLVELGAPTLKQKLFGGENEVDAAVNKALRPRKMFDSAGNAVSMSLLDELVEVSKDPLPPAERQKVNEHQVHKARLASLLGFEGPLGKDQQEELAKLQTLLNVPETGPSAEQRDHGRLDDEYEREQRRLAHKKRVEAALGGPTEAAKLIAESAAADPEGTRTALQAKKQDTKSSGGWTGALVTGVSSTLGPLKAFAIMLTQGAAFLGGFVKAASPDAFSTLKDVFGLIAAQLGSMLVPAIAKVITSLQQFASNLESFRTGKGGRAVSSFFSQGFNNNSGIPFWDSTGAVTGTVGALRGEEDPNRPQLVQRQKSAYEQLYDKAVLATNTVGGGVGGLRSYFGFSQTEVGYTEESLKARAEYDEKLKKRAAVPLKELFTPKQLEGMITLSSVKTTPQYSSFEDTYKKIQLDILSKSPLEKLLEQIHQEDFRILIEEMKVSNKIAQDIRDKKVGGTGQ